MPMNAFVKASSMVLSKIARLLRKSFALFSYCDIAENRLGLAASIFPSHVLLSAFYSYNRMQLLGR